ncbi:MAG: hypothetical protein V4636_12995 [Pseudomonadota bacterium]
MSENTEIMSPDPRVIAMTQEIMAQNARILEMNERLLRYLANSMVIVKAKP